MPSPQFRNSGVIAFLKYSPKLWSIMVLLMMVHTVKNVVAEKDAGIKTYMMVMGLNSVAFYGSHFLIGCFKVAFVMVVCAGVFSVGIVVSSRLPFLSLCV